MNALEGVMREGGETSNFRSNNKSKGKRKRSVLKRKTQGLSGIQEYKIPKAVFEKALRGLQDSKTSESTNCLTPTHLISDRKSEITKGSFATILYLCRIYLQAKDWGNLAKAISTSKFVKTYDLDRYFPTFLKYAIVLLKHKKNPELLDFLLRRVCKTEECSNEFWDRLSRLI